MTLGVFRSVSHADVLIKNYKKTHKVWSTASVLRRLKGNNEDGMKKQPVLKVGSFSDE